MKILAGNIYEPLYEIRHTFIDQPTKHLEFVYRVPISDPLSFTPEDMQTRYTDAIISDGKISQPSVKIEEHLDTLTRLRYTRNVVLEPCDEWLIQFWLLPHRYSQTKKSKMISYITYRTVSRSMAYNHLPQEIKETWRRIL